MKIKNLLLHIQFVIVILILLTFSGCKTMRNSGASQSPYLGKTFVTPFGMAFIENLPKAETVDDRILTNSSTVWVTTKQLDTIPSNCINCISSDRLETPIRISYVPKGTQFNAIKSYRIKYNLFYSLFNNDYDIIVVEDNYGNKAELPDFIFESFEEKMFSSEDNYDTKIIPVVKSIKDHGFYDDFCLIELEDDLKSLNQFINDFKFNGDISIQQSQKNVKIKFKTITSYLTYLRYKNDWNIKCN